MFLSRSYLSYLFILSSAVIIYASTYWDSASIWMCYAVLDINLQEYPIFLAVSTLSPVKTHTCIPFYFIISIVSATSSCS